MSDTNLDVVPQESVVDFPSEYDAQDGSPEPKADGYRPEGVDDDEEPVSLDEHEAEPEEAEDDEPEAEDGEAEDHEESEEDAEEVEDDLIEFDFGGNKLEVAKGDIPEEVAEKLDKFSKDIWADYTKKSQANAEVAKTIKARAESLEKIETLSGEALDAFTRGKSIKAEIEQLSAVNMQEMWRVNPDQARQLSDTLSAKQAELQSIIQTVDQYEYQLEQTRQAEFARVSDEGKQALDRKYKGFSTDIAPKLEAYAVKSGIPEAEAKTWAQSPIVAEFAYKAMLYDQMQAAGKPKATPKQAKPVKAMKNKGGSTASTDPNKMGFGELGKLLGIKD